MGVQVLPGWLARARCRNSTIWELAAEFPLVGAWVDGNIDRLGSDEQARTTLFFPGKTAGRQWMAAKSVCAACPVAADCLEYALSSGEQYGLWGGMAERGRRGMRGQRRRDAGPLRHGTSTGQYRRCAQVNGVACEYCRAWFAANRAPKSA